MAILGPQLELQELIQAIGIDPRLEWSSKKFNTFFRLANKKDPYSTAELVEEIIPFHELRQLSRRTVCRVIGLEAIKDTARCKAHPHIEYKIPLLIYHFWYEDEVVSANLPMHCSTYGYSSKLGLSMVYRMTELKPTHNENNQAIKWCYRTRCWTWAPNSRQCMKRYNQSEDCPSEAFRMAQPPVTLLADSQAVLPAQCQICYTWFKDTNQLVEHACHRSIEERIQTGCYLQNRIELHFDLDIGDETMSTCFIYVCHCCSMIFVRSRCFLSHSRFCDPSSARGNWTAYSRIDANSTMLPIQRNPGTLLVTGTPFLKLRSGCSNCLRSFTKQATGPGNNYYIAKNNNVLRWAFMTHALMLKAYSTQRSIVLLAKRNTTDLSQLKKRKVAYEVTMFL